MSVALRAAVAGAVAFACAGGTFDAGSLAARYPALAAHADARLADAAPYFAREASGLTLFLCRFGTDVPVPVRLPAGATPDERRVLERALDAWTALDLGVQFAVVPASADDGAKPFRGIEIELADAAPGAPPAADTIADCAVPTGPAGAGAAAAVDAELVYASIHLRRTRRDALGRELPLTSAELLGVALHELGHALGFPGHVNARGALMAARSQVEVARRWGRRVEEGGALVSPTLSALYALPSGARVGERALDPDAARTIEQVARAAEREGWRGPYARVGQRSARFVWRRPGRTSVAVELPRWADVLREGASPTLAPNAAARVLVGAGS